MSPSLWVGYLRLYYEYKNYLPSVQSAEMASQFSGNHDFEELGGNLSFCSFHSIVHCRSWDVIVSSSKFWPQTWQMTMVLEDGSSDKGNFRWCKKNDCDSNGSANLYSLFVVCCSRCRLIDELRHHLPQCSHSTSDAVGIEWILINAWKI